MIRSAASKVMWVGRATMFLVGLSVIVGVVFGLASVAVGADGQSFIIGQTNNAQSTSTLDKSGAGPALALKVDSGAPLAVNSGAKVRKLNADKLDGTDATQLGVNGLQIVTANSVFNSSSPKGATATCPAGKVVVGTGYDISGGTSGDPGSELIDVVPDLLLPGSTTVTAGATEEEPSDLNWSVEAIAICATAP